MSNSERAGTIAAPTVTTAKAGTTFRAARALPSPNVGLWLVALVVVSTAARTASAMFRPGSLFFPDEYVYTELARSIAATGLPEVRGRFIDFPGLVGPYLMAPGWLIGNVDLAFRILLGWASLWFSLAAIPAYALARRVGITARGALLVALVALLVPDAVFTSTLLTEPFAYPAFLVTVLAAVDALAYPAPRRQALALLLMIVLCLVRFEFAIVPAAYLVAAIGYSRFSVRQAARRQWVVVASLALLAVAALALGMHRIVGYYSGSANVHYPPAALARWFGVDLFVLLIAAGWVVVPGAILGFRYLLAREPHERAFAVLAPLLVAALLLVAATFGVKKGLVYERYMFYAVPLIAVAFVWSLESLPRNRLYAAVAYAAAAAALLLPLAVSLSSATSDMSPTLVGLDELGSGKATLAWALGLSVVALATGLRVGGRLTTAAVAVAVLLVVGSAGSVSFLSFDRDLMTRLDLPADVPRLHAPSGTALVTSAVTNRALLPRTLVWNPDVTRVLYLGGGPARDGFATTRVRLVPGRGFVGARGRPVAGPYAFDADTVALSISPAGRSSEQAVTSRAPVGIVFGLDQVDHFLETVSWARFVSGGKAVVTTIRFVSRYGPKTMAVSCGGVAQTVIVGRRPVTARIQVPRESERACRISLVRGTPVSYRNRTVSVQASLTAREVS